MIGTDLIRGIARRAGEDGTERGSIPMVVLVTVVGMLLSALLVPMLLNQDHATRFDATRVQSLDAAQSGLDLALGKIRSATDARGAGDATYLPCAPRSAPIGGSIDATGDVTFRVAIFYFRAGLDPVTADETTDAMTCVNGYGTYDRSTGDVTPASARIESVGQAGAGAGASKGRTLVATYKFRTSNTNVPGGIIRIFPSTAQSVAICLDAGAGVPTVGTAVTLQACSTTSTPADQQVFVYRTDLTLQLLSSVTATNANGLCLSVPSPTAGAAVTFAACRPLGTALFSQQWSFDDNGAFRASLSTTATDGVLSGYCLNVANQSPGTPLLLQGCTGNTSSPQQAWIPSPAVGAGAADVPQWVNYYEFGRCLDVTNQDVNSSFLIDYPCKQNPYPGAVAWNQKFVAPTIPAGSATASGPIYTTYNGTRYCLTSPRVANGLLTMKTCGQAGQTWSVQNDDNSLSYTMKFTVVDAVGLCMGLTAAQGGMTWSAVDVETCAGRGDQKWNAAPTTPATVNVQEK